MNIVVFGPLSQQLSPRSLRGEASLVRVCTIAEVIADHSRPNWWCQAIHKSFLHKIFISYKFAFSVQSFPLSVLSMSMALVYG